MRLNANATLLLLAAAAIGISLFSLPSAAPAGAQSVPGMRCYKANQAPGIVVAGRPVSVHVLDPIQEGNVTILKPTLVCLPAIVGDDSNSTSFQTPFVCYKTKNPPGTPKIPAKADSGPFSFPVPIVGNDTLLLKPSKILCLPLDMNV